MTARITSPPVWPIVPKTVWFAINCRADSTGHGIVLGDAAVAESAGAAGEPGDGLFRRVPITWRGPECDLLRAHNLTKATWGVRIPPGAHSMPRRVD